MTDPERKQVLADTVADGVKHGWGVEAQSDYQAVMVKGKRPNHLLHLILTIVTLGFWAVIWILVALSGGEKRKVVQVDESGNATVS
jgi:hypothetical protein